MCESGHDSKGWSKENLNNIRLGQMCYSGQLTGEDDIEVVASDLRTEPRGRIERG